MATHCLPHPNHDSDVQEIILSPRLLLVFGTPGTTFLVTPVHRSAYFVFRVSTSALFCFSKVWVVPNPIIRNGLGYLMEEHNGNEECKH